MGFDLSNYETVEERIDSFYKNNKEGRILTEIHTLSADKVIFKAYVYVKDTLVSTGFAYEREGSSPVNKTSHIENAETSAIGRALANYNYAKKGARPSREEMEKVARHQTQAPKVQENKVEEGSFSTANCENCNAGITANVSIYSKQKFGKKLCRNCQESQK